MDTQQQPQSTPAKRTGLSKEGMILLLAVIIQIVLSLFLFSLEEAKLNVVATKQRDTQAVLQARTLTPSPTASATPSASPRRVFERVGPATNSAVPVR